MTTQRNSRSNRPKPGEQLKAFFAVGGIATTLLGANFLANRDQVAPPAASQSFVLVDTAGTGVPTTNNPYLENAPIQQLIIPQPITRSRSS
jgi:hypothetical protein